MFLVFFNFWGHENNVLDVFFRFVCIIELYIVLPLKIEHWISMYTNVIKTYWHGEEEKNKCIHYYISDCWIILKLYKQSIKAEHIFWGHDIPIASSQFFFSFWNATHFSSNSFCCCSRLFFVCSDLLCNWN